MSKIATQSAEAHEKAAVEALKRVVPSASMDSDVVIALAQAHATLAVSHRLEALYRLQVASAEGGG